MPKRWAKVNGYGVGECVYVTPSGAPIYKFKYYLGAVRKEDIEFEDDERWKVIRFAKMKGAKTK